MKNRMFSNNLLFFGGFEDFKKKTVFEPNFDSFWINFGDANM